MDFAPHLRRGDRRLTGNLPSQRPDVRIAVVDWAPIVKLVEHATRAMADNGTTRVVERSLFGLFPTKDLELTPVDEQSRLRTRDAMLRHMASCMAQGPAALARGKQTLQDIRRMALQDLERKMREVKASSQATDNGLEAWITTLKRVELTCDVVTIWSPAGRAGKIVKGIATAKETFEKGGDFAQILRTVNDLGGISAVLSDDRHLEVVKKALGDFAHDWAKDQAANWLVGKAATKSAGLVDRRMDLINPFTGDTKGKFTFSQVAITTWVTEKLVESGGELLPDKAMDTPYSYFQAATESWYLKKAGEKKSEAR